MPSKSTSFSDQVYTSILDYMDDDDDFSGAVNELVRHGLEANGVEVDDT